MSSTPAGKRAAELFTAAGGDKQHAPRNIVKKLMNGEFSLTVTFWIFCVSVPLVGHLVFTRLIFPLLDLQSWHGSTAFLVWPLLALLYGLLASLGLWRSPRALFRQSPVGQPCRPRRHSRRARRRSLRRHDGRFLVHACRLASFPCP